MPCRYIVRFYGCGWSQEAEEGDHIASGQQLFFLQECLMGGTLHQMVLKAMGSTVRRPPAEPGSHAALAPCRRSAVCLGTCASSLC